MSLALGCPALNLLLFGLRLFIDTGGKYECRVMGEQGLHC